MLVRTDDEVYRVDAVWLGPPRATFPWRARYVAYGLGLMVMILVMFVQRRLGIGLDFFSIAWSLIATIVITRLLGKRINYERPLGQVIELFRHEVRGPRARTAVGGGSVRSRHVRVSRSATGPERGKRRRADRRRAEEHRAEREKGHRAERDKGHRAEREKGHSAEPRGPWKGRARASA